MRAMDRRVWLASDRPGERVAVGAPLPGVRLTSVENSDRCWKEYHLDFNLPGELVIQGSYTGRGSHNAGPGELMAFEPGDHHVTTRVSGGRARFDLIGIDPVEMGGAMAELNVRGRFHFRASHMRSPAVTRAWSR